MRASNLLETLPTHLADLACARLADLFDDEQHLFAYRFHKSQVEPTPPAWTLVYTAISLLGIAKAQQNGRVFDWLDFDAALDALIKLRRDAVRPGDVGLILWTDAFFGGHHADALIADIRKWTNAAAMRTFSTMELGWMLTGLCVLQQLRPSSDGLPVLREQFYHALVSRQVAGTGLFCHAQSRVAVEWLRNGIGNFADQVYAIYALVTYFETYHNRDALEHARHCGARLRELQGRQGQWWWHYDAPRGIVAARYPVYSVHQDGMAPMALMKLASVTGDDYAQAVERGLAWLLGDNELSTPLIAWEDSMIVRDVERCTGAAQIRYATVGLTRLGFPRLARQLERVGGFRPNREMRAYHLGWILYAFADHAPGVPSDPSLL